MHLLSDLLPSYTLDAIQESSNSSQAKALQWLLEDPSIESYSDDQLLQRYALATFYLATNGNQWKENSGWLDYDLHECDWYFSDQSYSMMFQSIVSTRTGNPCDYDQMKGDYVPYVKLWISGNGLVGTIPPEIYWLSSLESMDLSLQHPHYEALDMSWERSFTHDLAVETFGGPSTEHFDSTTDPNKALRGTISPHIGQLTNLHELKLSGNALSGSLPSEMGLLSNMKLEVRMIGNLLSGTLPTELFDLTSLRFLGLSINLFTGSVSSKGLVAPTSLYCVSLLCQKHRLQSLDSD